MTMTAATVDRPRPGRAPSRRRDRAVVALMAVEAVTLALFSTLHLTGALHVGSGNSNSSGAGVAEALICVAVAAGAVAFARRPADRGRSAALAAVAFAVLGFIVGLTFTVSGGDAIDLLYHAIMLPVLLATGVVLLWGRRRPSTLRTGPPADC
jgi:drug/metabolite transporter (DMT)-like permease